MGRTPSSNFYVVITVAMGIGSIVFLFVTQPAAAPVYTAVLLPFLVGIVAALQKGKETDARVEDAAALSRINTRKIDAVAVQVDDNTTTTERVEQVATQTHLAVNSRMDGLIAKVEQLADVQKQLIAAQKLAEGIAIGREQASAQDAPPPKDGQS